MPMGKRTQLAKGAIVFPNGTIQLIVMQNPPGEMSEGSLVNKIGVFARATNPVTAKTTISAASPTPFAKNTLSIRGHLEVLYSTWLNETSSNQIELGSRGLAYTIARVACAGACKPIS